MQVVWTQIRSTAKSFIFEKKCIRPQQKHEKLSSIKRVNEEFDAYAICAIRRRAVKCSGETAQLVMITRAFFGHSSNKYFIFMGRFVTIEDSKEFDHPRILTSAFNARAHTLLHQNLELQPTNCTAENHVTLEYLKIGVFVKTPRFR